MHLSYPCLCGTDAQEKGKPSPPKNNTIVDTMIEYYVPVTPDQEKKERFHGEGSTWTVLLSHSRGAWHPHGRSPHPSNLAADGWVTLRGL